MHNKLPLEVLNILKKFRDANFEIYIVGGAVRDLLTGSPVVDWDFTTNATPEKILALFPDGFYDNQYGTVGVPSNSDNLKPFEITTFRHESGYSDNRRPDSVEWGTTLEGDLARRDFTINAMAISTNDSADSLKIIDPYNGKKDLDRKLIRAVGDAHERFSEDALRMMRAIRIAAQLNFSIESTTHNAIETHKTLIHNIAKERVRDELLKLLSSPHPKEGIMLLKESGLLSEILPELDKTFGVDQKSPQRHHIYDVGTHCVEALKHCTSQDPIVRFATLIHDIGKPQTFKKQENGVITFYNHEVVGSRIAKQIAERLRLSKKDSDKLFRLVRWHQFTVDEHQNDSSIRRFIKNVGIETVDEMLALRIADRLGGGARETSWRLEEFKSRLLEVQKQPFAIKDLKVSGADVMEILNIPPGPKVGIILNLLFKKVEEKEIENDREQLLQEVKSHIEE